MSQRQPSIRVLAIEPVGRGRVLASATVEIAGSIVLTGVLLLQDEPSSPLRLQGPVHLVMGEQGARSFRSPIRFRKPFKAPLLAALARAYADRSEVD